MNYKILHFADLNLDASFAGQGFPLEYGIERRLDLRAALTRILAHARELKVNVVTIGGDLFLQEYLLPETADFIQQQFSLLAPIRVIIAPGSKDPYTNESPYGRLNWSKNVEIFSRGKLTHLELTPEIHLWGACNPSTSGQKLLNGFQPAKGVNILLLHALKNNSRDEIYTFDSEAVQAAGFRFALLGGEHVTEISLKEKCPFVYPGSPEPLSPSEENDSHNVALIEVDGEKIRVQSLSIQQWHYHTIDIDITNCTSTAGVARRIENAVEIEIVKTPHQAISVILNGQPHFDLNISDLRQLIQTSAIFRLDSHLGLSYDLEQMAHEQTVRGLLVQHFLARIRSATEDTERQEQLTALNFALQALEGKQVSLYETDAN
jgi:DNA repair exonuclease SbcCD nuclease subunit